MAYRVGWSPEAIEDLESIAEYIARDSEYYARAVITKMMETVRSLPLQPLIGRIVPEIDEESVRERFVFSYRLIYKIRDDSITIVAVIHGKRLLAPVANRIE